MQTDSNEPLRQSRSTTKSLSHLSCTLLTRQFSLLQLDASEETQHSSTGELAAILASAAILIVNPRLNWKI